MTEQHPITPPPELVASLRNSAPHGIRDAGVTREIWLIHNAFAAGADQELEACCEFLDDNELCDPNFHKDLRAARRPKPLSLKKQALDELDLIPTHDNEGRTVGVDVSIIRRALEQLDD